MSYMRLLLGLVGQGVEYAVDEVVSPAIPAVGQSAVVNRQWKRAEGTVGTPIVPRDDDGLARQLAHGIQFHSTTELPVGTPIRFSDREYSILNVQREPDMLGDPVYRYQCRVHVKGVEYAV